MGTAIAQAEVVAVRMPRPPSFFVAQSRSIEMKPIHVVSVATIFLIATSVTAHAQNGRGRGRGDEPHPPVAAEEQQRRIADEQRRTADYRRHLDEQARAAQQEAAQLQAQKRAAQYRAQQEYAAELARQQAEVRKERDYAREAYISTPHTYRFRVNGATRETNQFGVDALRQAVNLGYREGYRSGQADRQDHWKANYTNSPAYREATYGYTGSYVDQSDYSYYFREGFRRGYDDGYRSRQQYGSNANGNYSILSNVLSGILQLTTIH